MIREKCGEPVKGQKCDWLSNNSAGAGAYVVEEFKPNDRVVLAKKSDYWKGWSGKHLERIVMETVPEESTRLLRLRKGDLDVAAVGTTQLADLEQRIKDQKLRCSLTKTDKKGSQLLSLDAVDQPEQQNAAHERHQRAQGPGPLLQLRPLQPRKVMKGYAIRMTGMSPEGRPGNVPDYPLWPYDLKRPRSSWTRPRRRPAGAREGLKLPYRPDGVLPKEGVLMWQAWPPSDQADPRGVDAATLSSLQTSAPGQPMIEAALVPDFPTRTTSRTRRGPSTGRPPPWGYGAAFARAAPKTDDDRPRPPEIDPAKRRAIYRELELYFRESASTIMLACAGGALSEWNAQPRW